MKEPKQDWREDIDMICPPPTWEKDFKKEEAVTISLAAAQFIQDREALIKFIEQVEKDTAKHCAMIARESRLLFSGSNSTKNIADQARQVIATAIETHYKTKSNIEKLKKVIHN